MNRKQQILQLLNEDPNDSFLQYALAVELEKESNIPEAIKALEKLKQQDPDYYGLYYKLGELLEQNNQPDKAQSVYEEGIGVCTRLGQLKIKSELEQALFLLD